MRTNDLFRDLLENRIPGHETPTAVWITIMPRTGIFFLPKLADPTAPTVAELNAGIDLSQVVTIGVDAAWENKRAARNRAIADAAAAASQSFADMEAALLAFGEAAHKASPTYPAPPPKPWAGNIATQKRRRKL